MGVQALGLGLGTLLDELGVDQGDRRRPRFPLLFRLDQIRADRGPDGGGRARSRDIGLAITPMAYFAQFALDVPAVAMVTASHNDNGWTGVKMGAARPVTFGPEEMGRLQESSSPATSRYARRRRLSIRRGLSRPLHRRR